ncbi:MAG: hypothetical protein FJX47_16745 [Alphaproteobacteria bacterium]|nr:hypothetical protein [Alphaproteobacteria bacterium]
MVAKAADHYRRESRSEAKGIEGLFAQFGEVAIERSRPRIPSLEEIAKRRQSAQLLSTRRLIDRQPERALALIRRWLNER